MLQIPLNAAPFLCHKIELETARGLERASAWQKWFGTGWHCPLLWMVQSSVHWQCLHTRSRTYHRCSWMPVLDMDCGICFENLEDHDWHWYCVNHPRVQISAKLVFCNFFLLDMGDMIILTFLQLWWSHKVDVRNTIPPSSKSSPHTQPHNFQ